MGGRNQRFMANTPEEAGKNFADFIPRHDEFYGTDPDVFSDALAVVIISVIFNGIVVNPRHQTLVQNNIYNI